MKNITNIKNAYTHATIFHADDVFGTAFLQILNPEIKVSRVIKTDGIEDNDETIIFDIGLGEYDHHQPDRATRPIEDGYYFDKEGRMSMIPYCGFGLLWRDFGRNLCPSEKAWKKVDTTLVLPIDKTDNGVDRNMLSAAIHAVNPAWNSTKSSDDCFWQAVEMAKQILQSYIDNANAEAEAEEAVLNSRRDGQVLILDRYMPWQDVVIGQMPDVLYVVFPSARGGYCAQTVPVENGSFTARKGFPTEWLGHPDASLGMTFCHPGNFLLSCETEEQAVNCAKIAASK